MSVQGVGDRRRAFLVYVDDWLASKKIECMDAHEERGYWRLLLHEYTEPDCGLPDNDQTLAVWSKLGSQWWRLTREKRLRTEGLTSGAKIRSCFELRDGRLYNDRLLKEWNHQQEVRSARAAAGLQGGRPRKKQLLFNEKANGLVNEKQNESNAVYAYASSGFESSQATEKPVLPPARKPGVQETPRARDEAAQAVAESCMAIWRDYPGVKTEGDLRLILSVVDTAEQAAEMRRGLERWRASVQWREDPSKIPYLGNWASKGLWCDWVQPAPANGNRNHGKENTAVDRAKAILQGRGPDRAAGPAGPTAVLPAAK